ncbi:MAG: peptidase T [Clostridia bacterium]|nr:peptidase T [Clostridia bacterium]
MRTSYFAGGCFWCICGAIDGTPGVISVVSGYSGGDEENPSYEDVKAQKTGHRESIKVVFDESIMTYERLLDVFFDNIDPFDAEGQFIDRGRSYTTAVFFTNEEEREAAERKIAGIEAETGKKVRVAVEPFKSFYEAEERHIDFHKKNPELYEKELAESGRKKLSGDFREMTGAPENEEKEGKTMDVVKRFIEYVKIATMSDESSENTPSSEIQRNLGKKLEAELRASGAENVVCDECCYVYGYFPATPGHEDAPALGFIAHMDTAPDFNGFNVNPRIVENYDGGDIKLGESGRVLSPKNFPHLESKKGKTLIVTDGTSLLGGDDKAGAAEILTAVDELIKSGAPHGKICVAFTPDEEIGRGADKFDVERFGAKYAYTVDGGDVTEMEYETFNAAAAVFEVNGFNVHPGSAKDTMINASLVAMEINSMLPSGETPRDTAGYEGFFHLCSMEGNVEKAKLEYIVRDHSDEKFELRKALLKVIESKINQKYGEGTAVLKVRDQYRNMAQVIRGEFHLVEKALAAMRETGLDAKTQPVRGGTDGSRLSFMGLPCPNLGTGVYAMHGPYEHAVVEEMLASVEVIKRLIEKYSVFGK